MSSALLGWKRREFLGASLAGLAAGVFAAPGKLCAAEEQKSRESRSVEDQGPETLFLTWRDDPCTTMTIQWVGNDRSGEAQLEYSPLAEGSWRAAPIAVKDYPNSPAKVFRCELTGLTPDTEYKFRLGGSQRPLQFRTLPDRATDTIQFVSGGDSGVNEHAIQSNILAARQDPRFVLMGGDLAYDNGRKPEVFTEFLRNYRAKMVDGAGRLIPMISCIGNHEVDGGYGKPRSAAPQYLSLFDGLFSERTYGVLDIGDYLSLVLLDTGHIAPIDGEQTDWLKSTLAARQDRPHLLVANHVPAYPSYRAAEGKQAHAGTGQLQREHWCPLFERYNVNLVLEHHDHTFKRTHPLTNGLRDENGVVYLGDGSWGQLRALKDPESRSYLARASSHHHLMVHRLEGDDRFHVALNEAGRVADVCHSRSKRPAR